MIFALHSIGWSPNVMEPSFLRDRNWLLCYRAHTLCACLLQVIPCDWCVCMCVCVSVCQRMYTSVRTTGAVSDGNVVSSLNWLLCHYTAACVKWDMWSREGRQNKTGKREVTEKNSEHGREEITFKKLSWLRTDGEEKEVPSGHESACQEIET